MPVITKQKPTKQRLSKPSAKALTQAIEWLNTHEVDTYKYQNGFENPDYFGLPKRIANRLTLDDVDWLQNEIKLPKDHPIHL